MYVREICRLYYYFSIYHRVKNIYLPTDKWYCNYIVTIIISSILCYLYKYWLNHLKINVIYL